MWEYFNLLCTVKLLQSIVIHNQHAYIIAETSILYIQLHSATNQMLVWI